MTQFLQTLSKIYVIKKLGKYPFYGGVFFNPYLSGCNSVNEGLRMKTLYYKQPGLGIGYCIHDNATAVLFMVTLHTVWLSYYTNI